MFWSASVRERGDEFPEVVLKSLPKPLVTFSSRVSVMKVNRIKSLLVAAII